MFHAATLVSYAYYIVLFETLVHKHECAHNFNAHRSLLDIAYDKTHCVYEDISEHWAHIVNETKLSDIHVIVVIKHW